MPYALTFSRAIDVTDPEQYINECCIGGDMVLAQLMPALRKRYPDASAVQEDWGWFSWFDLESTKLAVDVHTLAQNSFQIHLTSRKSRLLLPAKVADTPELENLREIVLSALNAWPVEGLHSQKVDEKYLPVASAT
jgi:hypothetical protein